MFAEQQPSQHPPMLFDLFRIGRDVHAVATFAHARGRQHSLTDIDHAHPTDTDRRHPLRMTQRGNLNLRLLRRLPNGCPSGHGDGPAVDRQYDTLKNRFRIHRDHFEKSSAFHFIRGIVVVGHRAVQVWGITSRFQGELLPNESAMPRNRRLLLAVNRIRNTARDCGHEVNHSFIGLDQEVIAVGTLTASTNRIDADKCSAGSMKHIEPDVIRVDSDSFRVKKGILCARSVFPDAKDLRLSSY